MAKPKIQIAPFGPPTKSTHVRGDFFAQALASGNEVLILTPAMNREAAARQQLPSEAVECDWTPDPVTSRRIAGLLGSVDD
jgi:hypothetical protein